MMKKIVRLIALALVVGLVFAGCGSGGKSAEVPAETPAETPEEPTQEEAPAESEAGSDGKMTIYFLSKVLGNQYWSVVEEGARAATEDLGVNLVFTGLNMESEVEKQVQQLQDAVSAGADAIVVAPCDSKAMVSSVEETYNSGIPVVLLDSLVEKDVYDAAVVTDNIDAGRKAAEEMIRRLKEMGTDEGEEALVAVQIAATGSQSLIDRVDGFNAYWDEHAPENWRVLNEDIKVNDGDVSKATGYTQDFITAYPTLKGCYGANNGSTVGFVTGLIECDRKDIVLVGADYSPEILGMIEADEFSVATVVQQQYLMGYQSVETAYKIANGEDIGEKLVRTPVLVVDCSNIHSDEVQAIINP